MPPSKKASEATVEAERLRQARVEKVSQFPEVIAKIDSQLRGKKELEKQLAILDSVSLGLYEEIDKLCKKAPAEIVSDLVVEQVNDLIQETTQLITSDAYVQRLKSFVPAGDNPQHRDVVIVLRQIRQGLERCHSELRNEVSNLSASLREASGIAYALRTHLVNGGEVTNSSLVSHLLYDLPSRWITEDYSGKKIFDFSELDKVSIADYFSGADMV
jgi:hypothetical protein